MLLYMKRLLICCVFVVCLISTCSNSWPWKEIMFADPTVYVENGSGHGDLFKGYDGRYYYVYHVHNSDSKVTPRKTRIVPLNMEKGEGGIYNITVDKDNVIVPVWR